MKNYLLLLLLSLQTFVYAQNLISLGDLRPGNFSSEPAFLTNLQDKLLFWAKTPDGNQLYTVSANLGGLQLLKTLKNGSQSLAPLSNAVVLNNTAYFLTQGGPGRTLWASDGTENGSHLVKAFNFTEGPDQLLALDGKLWFTVAKTIYSYDVTQDALDSLYAAESNIENLTTTDKDLYWFAHDNPNPFYNHHYLFRGNADLDTIEQVMQVGSGSFSTSGSTQVLKHMNYQNARLEWGSIHYTQANGYQIYAQGLAHLDGFPLFTTTGNQCIWGSVYSDSLFGVFTANDCINAPPYPNNYQLLATRPNGTYSNILPPNTSHAYSGYGSFLGSPQFAFFKAQELNTGVELYCADNSAIVRLIKDLNPGTGSSNPFLLDLCDNRLVFIAIDGQNHSLWITDSVAGGVVKLADLPNGYINIAGQWGKVIGNKLVLNIDVQGLGMEPWVLEGLPCGAMVSAKEPEMKNDIVVSPNPTSGRFTVALPSDLPAEISILDLQGRCLLRNEEKGARSFDVLENKPSGFYFIIIRQNKRLSAFRIMKG